ncbi:MAG: phytoene desaturase [Flammeovirgaceae bacterium]|nr:phytoene desaturase [Flammeovirgaceae bacterium]
MFSHRLSLGTINFGSIETLEVLKQKAVVIGAGIGGLAMAIRLAVKGFEVSVLEATSQVGGKNKSFINNGFRFDTGPSLFTMPHLVDELFTLVGKDSSGYFKYKRLSVSCEYFFEDGTQITGYSSPKTFAKEIHNKLEVNGRLVQDYLDYSQNIKRLTGEIFLEKSLHKTKTILSKKALNAILNLDKLDVFTTMNKANEKRLKHPKLVQIFNRFATYNGSSPYKAPGILNIISSLEHGDGVFFPEGGMVNISERLFELALEIGVAFYMDEPAKEIITDNGKVCGVKSKFHHYKADLVVSNMDIFGTYKNLLPKLQKPRKILNQERSSSALVFYWGINKTFPQLDLHNIFFSQDYQEEFHYLFDKQQVFSDPTVYVNITAKYSSKDAPQGMENWFVMVNAPNNKGQNWEQIQYETKKNIIRKLNRMLGTNLDDCIKSERIWNPVGIEKDTFSYMGSIYGTSSNSKMSAFFRHPNFSNKINGLYFCGGSVHPGGGIPLALLSAKIVDSLVP